MTDNTPLGSAQHHASNALAIAGLVVLAAMNVLAGAMHVFPAWPWIAIAVIGTVTFSVINFKNTLEENSPWKSYGAMIGILITATIYAYPIGVHAINQP